VHHHFLREKVLQEEIVMKPVKTKEQIVDMFTKRLSDVEQRVILGFVVGIL